MGFIKSLFCKHVEVEIIRVLPTGNDLVRIVDMSCIDCGKIIPVIHDFRLKIGEHSRSAELEKLLIRTHWIDKIDGVIHSHFVIGKIPKGFKWDPTNLASRKRLMAKKKTTKKKPVKKKITKKGKKR